MNAAALVIGAPASKHAAATARLQTVLCELHDAVVAEQWLRTTAAADPACGVAAGQLVAIERAEAAQLRENWRHTWRAATTKKRRAWL
jgi:CHAD domain-containing protein